MMEKWRDPLAGYGPASVALHWFAAFALLALLMIGASMGGAAPALDRTVYWHISVAVLAYVPLSLRVWWRWRLGHPQPSQAQRGTAFTVGKWVHYAMLVCISGLLLSGPVLAWSTGLGIRLFDWVVLPGSTSPRAQFAAILWRVHSSLAQVLAGLIGLHILGVFKHLTFNRDDTFARMMRVRSR